MTDFWDLAGQFAIEDAQDGDLEALAMRVEQGSLTDNERKFLAGYLRGERQAKSGRPRASQTKKHKDDVKARYNWLGLDNNDIDLAAFDALEFLEEFEDKKLAQAHKEIAMILNETTTNTRARIKRVRAHLATGKKPSQYATSKRGKNGNMMQELAEALPFFSPIYGLSRSNTLRRACGEPLELPILLKLGRK